ncbi:macro domain-containing protein [Aliamphritea spongicola]|nr:macro domain-containing protein [Aliamphritea spongicola]
MVSPANSFGIMDGGLDLAIRHELGNNIEARVQDCIVREYYGELPVGNAAVVKTDHGVWPYLIVAPTMRVPENIRHTLNAYLAFRAVLIAVHRHNTLRPEDAIRTLICPGLGTGVGRMPPAQCAMQMKLAFEQLDRPARIPGASELREMYRRLATAD